MRIVPAMVDMRTTPAEKEEEAKEMVAPGFNIPDYPYGLSISLCEDELEKLDLDDADVQPGDMIHMHCMATVTSVSKSATSDKASCRVELQITHIAAEDEEEEDRSAVKRLYR